MQLNIAGQAYPDVSAFDQIVTEQPGFGEAAGKHPAEGAHIVDAFALIRGLAGQILIGV